jgi:hypothetical protein
MATSSVRLVKETDIGSSRQTSGGLCVSIRESGVTLLGGGVPKQPQDLGLAMSPNRSNTFFFQGRRKHPRAIINTPCVF